MRPLLTDSGPDSLSPLLILGNYFTLYWREVPWWEFETISTFSRAGIQMDHSMRQSVTKMKEPK